MQGEIARKWFSSGTSKTPSSKHFVEALLRPELIKIFESCLGSTRRHQTDGDLRTSIGRYGLFEELRACVGKII